MIESALVHEEEIDDDGKMMAFCKDTHTFKEGFIKVEPFNCIFPRGYMKHHEKIRDTQVREDDVWITSHPKAGTRWMQEIVWLLKNNLDYDTARTVPLNLRQPFNDMALIDPDNLFGAAESFSWAEKMPSPRIIKSHLSYDMLPKQIHEKQAKIVVIMRNPRDTCCSLLNHYRVTNNYTGTLETLVDAFLSDTAPYYGPYFVHVLSFWKKRHLPNVFICWYEELQGDFAATMKKLSEFLEVPISDDDIPELKEYVSFDKMKKNAMVNMDGKIAMVQKKFNGSTEGHMINKGKTGYWKDMLTDGMVKRFEEWEAKWLKDSDFKIVYKI